MYQIFPTSKDFGSNLTKKNGKVIIIMRTKDRPILLARALASVFSQTYENWHLCLVNDGGDPEPVERLLSIHKYIFENRITVKHHEKSLGMEAASNAALEGAEGDYIVVHDDDDAWRPSFLEETVNFLEKESNSRYAAVAARCEVVSEIIEDNMVIELETSPLGYWKERVDFADMLVINFIPPICLVIRREIVDIIGDYNSSLPVLGDWDYNLRLLMIGDIGTINHPLAYYHQRRSTDKYDIYGNSVNSGINKHLDYQVLYRNSMLRLLFNESPSSIGIMHVLLNKLNNIDNNIESLKRKLDWTHWDVNNRAPLDDPHLVEELRHHLYKMDKLLKPFQWVWKLFSPLRKILRKF